MVPHGSKACGLAAWLATGGGGHWEYRLCEFTAAGHAGALSDLLEQVEEESKIWMLLVLWVFHVGSV